ncbi:hypothetical protein INS49_008133 [Diaporthe citri]|uniref:uncharacterized protein n=1 Tax=Diaporthe citri TaxID=83186 RepID=UPI001C7F3F7B|nr:uncharacterized protein INS49_008133 [Diaporthe citri]KAG6363038.1 hypothetical protein INS49_008133 [Diaporthe citri]
MSDEEWAKSLATFQGVVDNEASDDRSIQLAWDTLRRDYKNKFNAKVSAHSSQQNEEPFGIWAAEKLSEQTLERVLCLVFRKDLAECDHMSLLRSTAAKANTTVWHMLLYFGASMFSESMLSKVRKRLRVFELDPVTGASNFKSAYLKALQAAAKRTKVVLDTTSVAATNAVRVFISTDLAAMASANPEFDPPARKTGGATGSSQAQGQGASHSVADTTRNMSKPRGTETQKTKNPEGSASTQGREDGLHLATADGETIKPSIESNIPDRQPDRAAQFPTAPRLLRSESEGRRSHLPSVAPMTRPDRHRGTSTRRNPPRKGRPGPMYVGVAPTDTGEAPIRNGETAVDLEIKAESSSVSATNRSTGEEPPTRVGSTIHCAPDMLQATSKRPLTVQDSEPATPKKDGTKRPKQTLTRSDLLDCGGDWDDETVLTILKQLESTCHAEYLVVDGMSDDDNLSTRNQLTGEAGTRGSLLIPLKLAAGQRLLVVVELNPPGKPGRGVLRYYDPCGPPDEDAVTEYAPAVKLAQLLFHVLPDRDLNRALWKSEYCVCPELSCEQDSGLSICLGAMYAVGGRPLPEIVDWLFWRHLVLGAFFSDDAAVQLRIARYRGETVHKLIRQGQMSDGALVPQGRRVSSDIEYLGTAAMNPVDRIECRADNAKKTIEVIHEGCRIFHGLQEKVDTAKADLKTRLDKSTYIRDSLRRKLNVGDQIVLGAPPTKVEQDDETAEAFDRMTLQQAIEEHGLCKARLDGLSASSESVRQALHELGIWRRDVNAAVLEDDASILNKGAN